MREGRFKKLVDELCNNTDPEAGDWITDEDIYEILEQGEKDWGSFWSEEMTIDEFIAANTKETIGLCLKRREEWFKRWFCGGKG